TFATYFAHLLGVDEITVNAPGAAYVLTGPCSGEHLFPITLFLGNFAGEPNQRPVIGTDYIMWDHNDKLAPGNFGWIYWVDGDGNNRCPYPNCKQQPSVNNSLRPNINDTTRSGLWRIGDWVHGSVGVNFQPVLNNNPPNFGRQLEYYVDGDADDDWPTVIIPIYDDVDGTGNNTVFRIAGFGAFHMTCAQNSKTHYVERDSGDCAPCGKTDKCVIGEFVRWVEEPFEDGCIDTGISAPSYRMPTQP
ncbi:MAG: hypothetical protein JXA93_06780, partial [Anaerolineae bacterium]|nr:hypothetical protein [Anaerolineae bacterium]